MLRIMRTKYISALVGAFALGACTYDFPVQDPPTTGQTDFTKMVAVGNSITAGFMDNALYNTAQANSYPAIIARQAELLGGGSFVQPTVSVANGCSNPGPPGNCSQGRLVLRNPLSPAPRPLRGNSADSSFARFSGNLTNLNNWGVPSASVLNAGVPAFAANPYYARIASNPGVSTLIGDAAASMANGGSFFTFWLGNNDVLGYALGGGGTVNQITGQPIPQITPQGVFETAFRGLLNRMLDAKADAEGAVANIPNVSSIPYFTTVPFNPVPVTSPAQRDQLNAGYAAYNGGLDQAVAAGLLSAAERDRRRISFAVGANRAVILDETLTALPGPFASLPLMRQATAEDRIVLPAASFIGTLVGGNPAAVNGVTVPLGDQWVLLPSEQTEIQNAINGFNNTIKAAVDAQAARLVLVDMNKALADVRAGLVSINGSSFTASITPPFGAFSLDGVHPNQRGQAFIANQFIQAINAKWGAKIPLCNPNDFVGNALPTP